MIRLLIGDVRARLAELPDASVHCVVTSPPYFGLRCYGHADQIGLEATPDEYVAALVGVFRDVRRVLRDDGTLWLNLGSSYASRDSGPSRSRGGVRAPAYGNDGTEPEGSPAPDFVCSDPDDERLAGSQTHRGRRHRNDQPTERGEPPSAPIDHDSETEGCASTSPGAFPLDVPPSKTRASLRRDQAACGPEATASAVPLELRTTADDERSNADMGFDRDTLGTSQSVRSSDGRSSGRGSSRRACSCGSCGICWAYLAIPSLRFKSKDLISVPHLVALALQADGWYLRSSIIWSKLNPMPESVTDRPTSAHENIFLLSKADRYWYDADAVKEPSVIGEGAVRRMGATAQSGTFRRDEDRQTVNDGARNLRNVWTVATQPFSDSHFATMPPAIAERCIKAGCPAGGMVLDPFGGAGTTGLVADRLGRNAVLIELNPAYAAMAERRIREDGPLFATVAAE